MVKLKKYPYTFELSGETIEVHKNMIRKINVDGREEKVSLDGDAIIASYSKEANDYVIVVKYSIGIYIITKKYGWMGPFETVEDITYNMEKGIPELKGKKSGKPGIYPL